MVLVKTASVLQKDFIILSLKMLIHKNDILEESFLTPYIP